MNRLLSIAPMMDWTCRHYRYFMRLITRHTLLYTEMITTGALLHGNQSRHLDFDPREHPIAVQLGGSDPRDLAQCASLCERWGYDEVNLNVGCPSDRVQSGKFGACLMKEPNLVRDCVAAIRDAVSIPVTVKSRIGVDDQDSYEQLHDFISIISESGCRVFIIHARKAWLQGLSPKENREIPPLRYDIVHQLKRDFPEHQFILNGGICDLQTAVAQHFHLDGVMIGREAYHNPYLFSTVDRDFYHDDHPIPSRAEVLERWIPYLERELASGTRIHSLIRHILGLYHGVSGGRYYRRTLTELAKQSHVQAQEILRAIPKNSS